MLAERAREAIGRCRSLATHTEEPGFTTRTFLSEPMRAVHAEVGGWMTHAGMDVRLDAAGNIRGRHAALRDDAPTLIIGSHLDTVPRAGAFDGVLGVVLGVTLVELLGGRRLPYAVEIVGFSEEEGVRFGVPFIGSRALAGTVDGELLARCDANGRRVSDAIRDFGLDPSRIPDAVAPRDAIGFVEFHIEQGPVLEQLGLPVGVVDLITGQTRVDVTFTGAARHAGTTPMSARRDALAAAAEWISGVEARATATRGLVATVGRVESVPGAGNVVCGLCRATLDVRHADDGIRRESAARLHELAIESGSRRGVTVDWQSRLDHPAVRMTPSLANLLGAAVERSGAPLHVMPSGAGHDAMILAARMPAAMLLLRTPGGISHHPDECVDEQAVVAALAAGLELLDDIAHHSAGADARA